jgi:hypothetical protein
MSVKQKMSFNKKKMSLQGPKSARFLKGKGAVRPATAIKPAKSVKREQGLGSREQGAGSQSTTGAIANQEALIASLEAQMASIEEQIASLKGEGQVQSAKCKVQSGDANQNHSELCTLNSALNRVGPNPLPAPTLVIMSVSSNSILVDWDKVTNANGYIIEVANDSLFTDPVSLNIDATATSWNIDGLNANTTYYIRVMATGTGVNGNSGWSNVQSIKTLNDMPGGMDDGIVSDLQNWLEQEQSLFQNTAALIPQLETTELNTTDRRRLNGSGVRRYGFIEKVFEVSADYPQFWPAFGDGREEMAEYVKEIDVLRNLLIWFRFASRVVQDLLLIAGNEAFRIAGAYYTLAREGAKRNNPEAVQVYDMLRLFWKRPRRIMEEPTEMEMLRDAKALLRGRKDGMVSVRNESDSVIKGKKVIVDNTFPKPRGGVKVVESAEVE